ncbi:MAG: hypothetical protein ACK5IQ_04190 [Bacteroidales bacterium]
MKYILITLSLLFVIANKAKAQDDTELDPMLITFSAKLISSLDSSSIAFAHIINPRTRNGVITDDDGVFTIQMLNVDSLIVTAVGIKKTVLKVYPDYEEGTVVTYILQADVYNIDNVEVQGDNRIDLGFEEGKERNTLDPKYRSDYYKDKPGVLEAIFSPLSYLGYKFSKREQEKRALLTTIRDEERWEAVSEMYNKKTVMELTGLSEREVEDFMLYVNKKVDILKLKTQQDVNFAVLAAYKEYKEEGR